MLKLSVGISHFCVCFIFDVGIQHYRFPLLTASIVFDRFEYFHFHSILEILFLFYS